MKKLGYSLFSLLLAAAHAFAQQDVKLSPRQLQEDLALVKQQIYNVHAYPYTEIDQKEYDRLFSEIHSGLKDSLTATAFMKKIKPLFARLCDEHAQVSLPDSLLETPYRSGGAFLPITLAFDGKNYRIDKILNEGSPLQPGDVITQIDLEDIDKLVKRSAGYSSGYPEQRLEKALKQFGYLYTWTVPDARSHFKITTRNGKTVRLAGVSANTWKAELDRQSGWNVQCQDYVYYEKIGDAGYVNACSFNVPHQDLDAVQRRIDTIYEQVKADAPKYLFIDVSKNSGGQSVVGSMLIDGFNGKPYRGYSVDFRRSESYIRLLKSWGMDAPDYYKAANEGDLIHIGGDTVRPDERPGRFAGKVFIVVGNGTFSSAMMFATIIKDNQLATIVGETPTLGHPNKFGEMYNTALPNTKVRLLFGVKRWLRPSGDTKNNQLFPDLPVTLTDDKAQLIKRILDKQNSGTTASAPQR